MRSKKSRYCPKPIPLWKEESGCSEAKLRQLAQELAVKLNRGDRVLLEGPLGAGKTTFARFLLEALGVRQPPEGSPTFAIVHEYTSPKGEVVHMDFYRLKQEREIDEIGLPDYFWARELIAITEWSSLWPDFEKGIRRSGRCWEVRLRMSSENEDLRRVEIWGPMPHSISGS